MYAATNAIAAMTTVRSTISATGRYGTPAVRRRRASRSEAARKTPDPHGRGHIGRGRVCGRFVE
ncbi:hypothetical protein STANM309S_06513 [Streptomyces tanashiensis]